MAARVIAPASPRLRRTGPSGVEQVSARNATVSTCAHHTAETSWSEPVRTTGLNTAEF